MQNKESGVFKDRPFEERVEKYKFLMAKNSGKVPIIIERHPDSKFVEAD